MAGTLYLIEGPQSPVVELDDMKLHLNAQDSDDEDDLIQAFERAAVAQLENKTKRSFIERTYELRLDCFPPERTICLPRSPLIEVDSVTYRDEDEALQNLGEDIYHVIGANAERAAGRIRLKTNESWPTTASDYPEAVIIRFRAGFLDVSVSPPADAVPEALHHAIKLLTGHFFANRESVVLGVSVVELPQAVEALIEDYINYGDEA